MHANDAACPALGPPAPRIVSSDAGTNHDGDHCCKPHAVPGPARGLRRHAKRRMLRAVVSQHPSDDPERPFFATAAKGTEGVLRDELKELRIPRVKATRGGVHFGGDFSDADRGVRAQPHRDARARASGELPRRERRRRCTRA